MIGVYPTPVESLFVGGVRLWVKRDDRSHEDYGGSKVRKLGPLLDDAVLKRASRILTLGAVGSHHVLATAVHGSARGIPVAAILVPQPGTLHVRETICASLAAGVTPICVSSYVGVPFAIARHRAKTDAFIPLGGSSPLGTRGYVDAALELAQQVKQGELPEPDWIVVALGSGGTAAGLAAGLAATTLRTRVLAVAVSTPLFALRFILGRRLAELGLPSEAQRNARARLMFSGEFVGRGYGYETDAGREATALATDVGLALDPTYTAKAFAAALTRAKGGESVLYWHTLADPRSPAILRGRKVTELPPSVAKLLQPLG